MRGLCCCPSYPLLFCNGHRLPGEAVRYEYPFRLPAVAGSCLW